MYTLITVHLDHPGLEDGHTSGCVERKRFSNCLLRRIKGELRWLVFAPFGMLCDETNADGRRASRAGGKDLGDAVSLFGAM